MGAAICWDQWYPESARAMALQGAEVLLYPTAIGSEPEEAGAIDTSVLWRRAMIGHAVSNSCYLAAANRVGTERIEDQEQTYYGTSFIADYQGEVIAEANRTDEAVIVAHARSRRGPELPGRHGVLQGPPAGPVRAADNLRRPDSEEVVPRGAAHQLCQGVGLFTG